MSAIALSPNTLGLAVCHVKAEAQEAQRNSSGQQENGYYVEFEFLEGHITPKSLERLLDNSQLLSRRGDATLVLQIEADYAGKNSPAGKWAQHAAGHKIQQYQALLDLLSSRYPTASICNQQAASKEKAIRVLTQQDPASAAVAHISGGNAQVSARAETFGTPEASKAFKKKKQVMRDVAGGFLKSELCLNPEASEVFSSFLADVRGQLADALWLALYDVLEQLKQQQKHKRGRGADAKGVYKAKKRPMTTTIPVAAGLPPAASTAADNDEIVVVGVTTLQGAPVTPVQPRRHRAGSTTAAGTAATTMPAGRRVRRRLDINTTPCGAIDLTDD